MNAEPSSRAAEPLVVGVGEALWDMLPGGKQLGGAPTNFAYHAHALGAQAWLVTRIGRDPLGHEILERLRALSLPSDLVSVDPAAPTGTVSVELSADGQPRFTIHEKVAWDNLVATDAAREVMSRADAVCFGSLAQRSPMARTAIQALVAATPARALRVFDINLRQHYFSREIIERSLVAANVLKINDQELPVLAGMFQLRGDAPDQLSELARRFELQAVALTRGAQGSLLYSLGRFSSHPGIRVKVVDCVGAGDAFTAALILGLLREWPLDKTNQHANALAAFVCSQPGATPPVPENLREPFAVCGNG